METPSGKAAEDENFPVGSWLVSRHLRPHILTFYAYARAIDDIADNPDLAPDEKIARLGGFAGAIQDGTGGYGVFQKAHAMHLSLTETRVAPGHCVTLTHAFKQDAVKLRYTDWNDLVDYCNFSAAPVGRYLIDLHGECASTYPASDALCNALQVLNHLQDCGDDHARLNRVYLPQDWMSEAGISVEALGRSRTTAGLRRVLDRCLDATDNLLTLASELPRRIRNRRFALEAAVILAVARKLSRELRRRDPLAERVVLSRTQYAACFFRGILVVMLQPLRHETTNPVSAPV